VQPLEPGDLVTKTAEELRKMTFKQLVRLAASLGINVEELDKKTQVLTKLMESAVEVTLQN
jgi:hypothetical protein